MIAVVDTLTDVIGEAGCVIVTMAEEATTETVAVVATAETTIVGPTTEIPTEEDTIETGEAVLATRTVGIAHRLVSIFIASNTNLFPVCIYTFNPLFFPLSECVVKFPLVSCM